MFKTPVRVLIGLGYPSEVGSVIEAYRLLENWPVSGRDAAHSVALKACRAALKGEIETETVRGLFAAFADRHDMLAHNPGLVPAVGGRQNSGPHIR
ncbi:DUF982 domain-containing protein [Rhizobium tubonense]